jgi:lactate 2-monooxygenase
VAGAAGAEDTMRANEEAFRRWRIVPRMLRDVSGRDLSTTVLRTECPAPLGLAPVGAQTVVHADGEQASARAAAAVGLPMTVSTVSTMTMEEIAAAGDGPKWFQLYCPTDRDLAASFLARAVGQ